MAETTNRGVSAAPPRASIYDLGYRNYDGARLGRRYAVVSLFVYSMRSIFGLGRSAMAKLFPIGLAAIAAIPALILLGVAALAPEHFELAKPVEYFGFISIILALFCAVSAPELIGRDQRHHILALYFSRALSRQDYVASKLLALILALFLVTVTPQVLLLVGNAVSTSDLVGYAKDNIDLLAPILASSALVAAFMASVSMAIAVQTSRRAFSTGAVIIVFAVLSLIGGSLADTLTGGIEKYSLLISPFGMLEGAVYWLFGATPGPDTNLAKVDLDGVYYFAAALGYTAAAMVVLFRRVQRLSV